MADLRQDMEPRTSDPAKSHISPHHHHHPFRHGYQSLRSSSALWWWLAAILLLIGDLIRGGRARSPWVTQTESSHSQRTHSLTCPCVTGIHSLHTHWLHSPPTRVKKY
uniref:(northern house mosquito) hypothetical protein n=1 Tax=Culex pipiens TaxID=7175 RepID=A0A8D8DF48_CULPI